MVNPLNPQMLDRVRDAVAAAEKGTSGEMRVCIVQRALLPDSLAGALAAGLGGAGAWLVARELAWGHPGWREIALAAACALALGALASWLVPRLALERRVRRRAQQEFARLGIARTSGRTGVLLMLALAERRAVLLADRGIHEKVADGTWDHLIGDLVGSLSAGKFEAGLVGGVGEIGRILREHLPAGADDPDELPNEVEVR